MIDPVRLTNREEEVLKLLVAGCKNREIAELLNISTRTTESHRKNIRQKIAAKTGIKLSAVTRRTLVMWAKDRIKPMVIDRITPVVVLVNGEPVDDVDSTTVVVSEH